MRQTIQGRKYGSDIAPKAKRAFCMGEELDRSYMKSQARVSPDLCYAVFPRCHHSRGVMSVEENAILKRTFEAIGFGLALRCHMAKIGYHNAALY